MSWLKSFAEDAALSDQFRSREDRRQLLASGLFGEAGSVLAESKKMAREGTAYPLYRQRLTEELGDSLWYFVRLATESNPKLLEELLALEPLKAAAPDRLKISLELGAAVGDVLRFIGSSHEPQLRTALIAVWRCLTAIASEAGIDMEAVAKFNLAKTSSRWPKTREFHPFLDDNAPKEEQLPRTLAIRFREFERGTRREVLLRCNELNIGDRLTDNISDADGYRYHDIFHMSYAVFLGWSPITRSLLRCKRKSDRLLDENEDGARAGIIEEAVSAIVFSRAKNMKYFEGATQVDYDLLKCIQEFVRGYEVERIPLWQWERAILEGFRIFRLLGAGRGGVVSWDMTKHTLDYAPLTDEDSAGAAAR